MLRTIVLFVLFTGVVQAEDEMKALEFKISPTAVFNNAEQILQSSSFQKSVQQQRDTLKKAKIQRDDVSVNRRQQETAVKAFQETQLTRL